MVTYYYLRVRYVTNYCLKDVPPDYQSAVAKRLKENGFNTCGS